MKSQFYRPCRVDSPDAKEGYIDAIFHRFEKLSELKQYTGADGELHTAVVTRMIAIVEMYDGYVFFVDPEEVRFIDGFAQRIVSKYTEDETMPALKNCIVEMEMPKKKWK